MRQSTKQMIIQRSYQQNELSDIRESLITEMSEMKHEDPQPAGTWRMFDHAHVPKRLP